MTRSALTAIVVVNYGSHQLLESNISAVARQCPEALIVVVDNYSTQSERDAIEVICVAQGWRLVVTDSNLGYGAGNNLGVASAAAAGAERFLLLNPDARIDAASVALLERVIDAEPMTMASPVITTSSGRVWFDGSDLYLDRGRMRATRHRAQGSNTPVRMWLTGACMMLSRDLWNRLGGFDDRYFLYWEDVDLSWRCEDAGGRLKIVREANAVHDEGGTQAARGGERSRSTTYYYFNTRNRLVFAGAHLDRLTQWRWIATSAQEAYNILLRGGRRQLLSLAPWRAVLAGSLAGLRLMNRPAGARAHRPLRVLQSFGRPRPTTNPYIAMLKECLDHHSEVDLLTFTWRRGLTANVDVFHAHWPETLVDGQNPLKRAVRQVLFLLMLIRFRFRGTTIVRTRHNLDLPRGISRRQTILLKLFERWTTLLIRLNAHTEIKNRPFVTILHGHYRDWFRSYPRNERQRGRLTYFGLVRRYKAIDTLLTAFRQLPTDGEPFRLYVGGQPSTEELRAEIAGLAAGDTRIEAHLEFLSDSELVAAATAAELVVLPYLEMHNSGSVLTALSLDRPVLVPDNHVNQTLAEEVGEGWVYCYQPPLSAFHLLDTLNRVQQTAPDGSPDLSRRNWTRTADEHVSAYRQAMSLAWIQQPR